MVASMFTVLLKGFEGKALDHNDFEKIAATES